MATYYVDATGGADANTGLLPTDAWKTIAKVNGATFAPGDSILFKRGETWTGTALTPPNDGTSAAHITIADYGGGSLPLIDGNDTVECVNLTGRDYVDVQNVECTQGLNYGFNLDATTYVTITDCVAHDCGNDGLAITGAHDITVLRGSYYATYQRVPGTTNGGITVEDNCHDILIRGVRCYGNTSPSGHGITLHNHAGSVFPYNVILENCACYSNTAYGIQVWKQDAGADTARNIVIRDCLVYSNTSVGIRMNGTGGNPLNGVVLERTHVLGNGNRQLYLTEADNITVRRCIFSAAVALPVQVEATSDVSLLNCTVYTTAAVTTSYLVQVQDASTTNFIMKNCCLEAESTLVWMVGIIAGCGVVGMDLNYNLYEQTATSTRWLWLVSGYNWANWLANSGMDANSPLAGQDPLFVDEANNGFYLRHGSPALNAGTPIAGMSFYGAAPDCGRWEMRWPSQRARQRRIPAWRFT